MICASENGYTEIVKLLVEKRANVNVKEKLWGRAVLWWASYSGYTEIVKLLIEKRADINARDNDGVTALRVASELRRNKIVKLLEAAGARRF